MIDFVVFVFNVYNEYFTPFAEEILVCMRLLDTFALKYFEVYGGQDSVKHKNELRASMEKMESSLWYWRKGNSRNRLVCVKTMQEIMNKVKVMSSQKSDDSASKLKSKLKMLVSARESELQAWQNLEEKYPSSSLTSFLQEFKSESFDAGMLHNSLGLLSHFPPLVSYFDLLPPLSSLPQSIALSRK